MTSSPVPTIPAATFEGRRKAAYEALGDGVMVLPAAPIQYSSRDTERAYCPDRELYYLTGLTEPESVAVLVGGHDPKLIVFVRDKDAEAELWAGPRMGPEVAGERHGADECFGLSDLETRLEEFLAKADRIHFRSRSGGLVERVVSGALVRARSRGPRTGSGPRGVVDPGEVIDELRSIKDEHELALIRRACEITVQGHRTGASAVAPGVGEWVIEAAVDSAFRASGARGTGFGTIVGSGPNGCVLHYVENAAVVGADALVLVDAGAEFGMYHGDITRTYPASGAFTSKQRDVYAVVEAALHAGVEAVRPGRTIASVHDSVTRVLVQGLVDLDVLEGGVEDLISADAHKVFFPHQTSHWLGLDVHDPGDYARGGEACELKSGMVFTIEPGLYFRSELSEGGAERYSGIGIRVEDDVAVTASGCEVLTSALPTKASEIEALVGAAS